MRIVPVEDQKILFQNRADKNLLSIPIPVLGIEAYHIPIPSEISQFQFRRNQGIELPACRWGTVRVVSEFANFESKFECSNAFSFQDGTFFVILNFSKNLNL